MHAELGALYRSTDDFAVAVLPYIDGKLDMVIALAAKDKFASVRDQVSALDYEVRGGTAEEFAQFMMHDISRYKRLAEDMALAED